MEQMSRIPSCVLGCLVQEEESHCPSPTKGVFEGMAITFHTQHVPNTQGAGSTYFGGSHLFVTCLGDSAFPENC